MVYDSKKYKELICKAIEPANTPAFRSMPFLIANVGSEYIYSKLRISSPNEQNTSYRTFDFSFNYNNLKIEESFVCRIEFFSHSCDDCYKKIILDSGVILTAEELDDFILVIYKYHDMKSSINQSYDISIYDNSSKICNLENVKSLINSKSLDKNKIFFYRRFNDDYRWCSYDERWVFMDGKEYSENALNLSLSQWYDLFKPHSNSFWDIKNLFSKNNKLSFYSKDIKWNSETLYEWQCPLGHCWTAPVKELTANTILTNYCPICRELIPKFTFNSNEEHAKIIYDTILNAQSEFKTNDIESVIVSLEEEISEFQEMYDMGIIWFDHAKMPDSISFYFAYSNGKHGDIDKVICETYGEISQIDEFAFRAVIPANYYKEIELLSESYADKKLLNGIENEELTFFLANHNVLHRLRSLSSLAHPFGKCVSIGSSMTEYRSTIRERRMQIYNELVGENKATHKWKSEQLLYHIIKGIFNDAIFQYKTSWLGNQSLDIYIPSLKTGIEYQGQQHYQPVDLFGGEEQFKERQKLDERKKKLCRQNDVLLIEWKYTLEINEENVRLMLQNI